MNTPVLTRTILFTVTSLLSFSAWAFGSGVFSSEISMYSACAAVFLILGGVSLLPGSQLHSAGEKALFCLCFLVGFLLYAVVWSVAWFSFRDTFGEVIGSAIGLLILTAILRIKLKGTGSLMTAFAALFLWYTLGYYTGGFLYKALQNRGPFGIDLAASAQTITLLARFSWGLCFGLGLGFGLSRMIHLSRQS